MGTVTFRVLDKSSKSWGLKQNNAKGVRRNKHGVNVEKMIGYFPGKESPFVEDNPESTPTRIPAFEKNDATGFTELTVDSSKIGLINYLKTHSWFNVHYILFDEEQEAKRQLKTFDQYEQALLHISTLTDPQVRALGFLVFGSSTLNNNTTTMKLDLKQTARDTPQRITEIIEQIDYSTKMIAATAFAENIVEANDAKSAVIWKHNEGIIIRVATGENPIDKLGEYLLRESDDASTTLQEIADKIGYSANEKPTEVVEDDRDAEIARLKEQVALLSQNSEVEENTELIEARARYLEVLGKEVPGNMKNNLEWILGKIAEQ